MGLLKLLCHDVREANSIFPFSTFRINYTFTVCRASEATAYSGSYSLGLPGGSDGKECACNAGDLGLIPGLGRSPGEGKGYPLQYSELKNSVQTKSMGFQRV